MESQQYAFEMNKKIPDYNDPKNNCWILMSGTRQVARTLQEVRTLIGGKDGSGLQNDINKTWKQICSLELKRH